MKNTYTILEVSKISEYNWEDFIEKDISQCRVSVDKLKFIVELNTLNNDLYDIINGDSVRSLITQLEWKTVWCGLFDPSIAAQIPIDSPLVLESSIEECFTIDGNIVISVLAELIGYKEEGRRLWIERKENFDDIWLCYYDEFNEYFEFPVKEIMTLPEMFMKLDR